MLADEMEEDAYRRIFPLSYFDRLLLKSVRHDSRPLLAVRPTTIELSPHFRPAPSATVADCSARVMIGETTMLAVIKLELMTPPAESPDEGSLVVEFNMPHICSGDSEPGKPSEVATVISEQLSDVIIRSGMINMKEFCLIDQKAAWMAYLCITCLNADGCLFDAALLSAVAAFTHLKFPLVSYACKKLDG